MVSHCWLWAEQTVFVYVGFKELLTRLRPRFQESVFFLGTECTAGNSFMLNGQKTVVRTGIIAQDSLMLLNNSPGSYSTGKPRLK